MAECETPRFAAIIPAYNENESIGDLVKEVKRHALPIVVDDGSIDDTGSSAVQAGAIVISHPQNQGYDAALQTGLFWAIHVGCEFAVTIDADGQHKPSSIEQFKFALLDGADLVVGVRDKHQRLAETLFSQVCKRLWSVEDPMCGLRGYRLSHLKRLGHFDSYKSIGTEYTIRCVRSNLRIRSLPVATCARQQGEARFGQGLLPNLRILRALAIGLIRAKAF